MNKILNNKKIAVCFLLPAVAVYIFTMIVPILWSLSYSFFSWDGFGSMEFAGLKNYIYMFTKDRVFWTAFRNNVFYSLINIVLQMGISLAIAILLTRVKRGSGILQTLYYVPVIISSVAMAEVFVKAFSANPPGIINEVIRIFIPSFEGIAWLGEMNTAFPTVAFAEAYKNLGVYMLIFYSALISLPEDVGEAARIDGANVVQSYIYVKIPMIRNILMTSLILIANGTLKAFDMSYLITGGEPGGSTELLATHMYKQGFSALNYGYASALAVFMAVESLLVVVAIRGIYTKYSKER